MNKTITGLVSVNDTSEIEAITGIVSATEGCYMEAVEEDYILIDALSIELGIALCAAGFLTEEDVNDFAELDNLKFYIN